MSENCAILRTPGACIKDLTSAGGGSSSGGPGSGSISGSSSGSGSDSGSGSISGFGSGSGSSSGSDSGSSGASRLKGAFTKLNLKALKIFKAEPEGKYTVPGLLSIDAEGGDVHVQRWNSCDDSGNAQDEVKGENFFKGVDGIKLSVGPSQPCGPSDNTTCEESALAFIAGKGCDVKACAAEGQEIKVNIEAIKVDGEGKMSIGAAAEFTLKANTINILRFTEDKQGDVTFYIPEVVDFSEENSVCMTNTGVLACEFFPSLA